MSTKEIDNMCYIYKKDRNKNMKQVSIASVQAKTKKSVMEEFKNTRKNIKMTQVELSEITGIPQPNITRFESGKSNPTLEMMVKMAAAMGMEIEISLKKIEK